MSSAKVRLSRPLLVLFAVTCGVSVANLYISQPLLDLIGRSLSVEPATAGLISTAAQVGYVCGLAFIVPLGDLVQRKRLIVALLLVAASAELVAAGSNSIGLLIGATVIAGIASCVAQILLPFAASLAPEAERGKAVGVVMSGLLTGILLARTVSGLIADLGSWRTTYLFAAALMALMALVMSRSLPASKSTSDLPYFSALKSVLTLIRREPVLRQRMVVGATGMATFSLFWTAIAFMLSKPPYSYGEATIGLFGLAGLAGAVAAQVSGRLADGKHRHLATLGYLLLNLVSWVAIGFGASSLVALLVGIVVLDLGVQGLQISNQAAIYELDGNARSRITTAYMVSYFLGGIFGSALAGSAWQHGGWNTVCWLGSGIATFGIVVWLLTQRQLRVVQAAR